MYKLMLRTAVAYLLLLTIPVAVFGLIVYGGTARALHRQNLDSQARELEGLIGELDRIAVETGEAARSFARGAAVRDEEELAAALDRVTAALDAASRVIYFSRREHRLYDGSWYSLEAAPTGQEYLNDVGSASGTPYPVEDGIVLLYPLSFHNGISDQSMGFVVDVDGEFLHAGGSAGTLFSVYGPDNTLLAANHTGSVLRYFSSHGKELVYEDSPYLCHSAVSPNTGWRYVALFPVTSQPLLEKARINLILASVLSLLLCGAVAIAGIRLTYRPVQRMLLLIERKAQTNLHRATFPEIMEALQGIISSRNVLSAKATLQHRLILDSFLRQLLRGDISAAELEERQGDLGIFLEKPGFHLYRVGLSRGGQRLTEVPYALIDEINAYHENLFAVLDDDLHLILLYNFHLDFKISMRPLLDLLYSFSHPEGEMEWEIQESALYTDILLTGSKYLELCLADRRPVAGSMGRISCIAYEREDLNRLQNALLQRDFAAAGTLIRDTVDALSQGQKGGKSVKFFLYEALKVITESLELLVIAPEQLPVRDTDILYALDAGDTAVCLAYLDRWFEAMDHNPRKERDLLERIQQIIQREFSSLQFSVHTIAAETGYSYNYISRYFKERTGQNLSDNISQKRIALFKELLLSTGDTVQSLIHRVGYDNDASFIRKFKKLEGVTPAQYRKLHGE